MRWFPAGPGEGVFSWLSGLGIGIRDPSDDELRRLVVEGGVGLRYGEGVVSVSGLKLWPIVPSSTLLLTFHRGRDDLMSDPRNEAYEPAALGVEMERPMHMEEYGDEFPHGDVGGVDEAEERRPLRLLAGLLPPMELPGRRIGAGDLLRSCPRGFGGLSWTELAGELPGVFLPEVMSREAREEIESRSACVSSCRSKSV